MLALRLQTKKEQHITYHEGFTLPESIIEAIASQGLDGLPELIRVMINLAMQAERQDYLNAEPYQRTPEREAHASGYKSKTMRTRVGEITFAVPQVREGGFYPQALEKGLRSERVLTLALAAQIIHETNCRMGRKCSSSPSSTRRWTTSKCASQSFSRVP